MSQSSPYSWWSPGEDPEDEELGIGVFRYPDGTSRYGQDPEGAAALRQAGKVGPPPGDVLPPGMQDPNEYGPPPPPATRNEPTVSKAGDLQSAIAEQARAANLNPEALMSVIQHESGGNPQAVNAQTGKHAGLIQFSQDGWPSVAKAAGRPEVTWDQMRNMSAKEQAPFVAAYYKGKGLGPDSTAGDYKLAAFMPAYASTGDDFVLGEKDSEQMMGDVRSGRVWEQNQGLDRNKDGKITSGEVRGTSGSSALPQPSTQGISTPTAPPGLALAEVSQTGSPLTPQQMQEREGQYNAQATQEREARGAALLDQRQALQNVQDQQVQVAQQREQQAKADQQREELVQKEASQRIDTELMQPVQRLDPKRYIKNMSTAQQVFGVLGLLTSAVGQTFLQMNGQNAQNYAMQWLDKSIDQDIQAQLEEIRQGEVSTKNRVAHWTRVFDNAEAGKTAAKLEAEQAVNSRLKANLLDVDDANLQAQAVAVDQEIQKRALDSVNALRENEANKIRMRFEAPKVAPRPVGPVPTGANDPIKTDPAYRAQVAAHFDEAKDGEKLDKFKAGMDKVNALRATKKELEELYRVQPNAQGAYPAEGNYDSSATGIDPFDALDDLSDAGATRNRRLAKAWEGVRIASRSEWKTEPNGQQIQERFQNLGVPDRDADVPLALQRLNDTLTQAENLLESGTLPQVRAYFWSQQGPPVGASRVTGRIP